MVAGQTPELTEDEAELYDRQIRLWGLDSQKRFVLCHYSPVFSLSVFRLEVIAGFFNVLKC